MRFRAHQTPVWVIWGLVGVFGVVEAIAWTVAGGIPRRPGVLVQVMTAWVVMVILASLATRRLRSQEQRIRAHEHTHQETLGEIEQLQTQNAMLEIIARSVDVTLAFQALASRIARLVPCDRVGLALLTENGQEFQTYTARVNQDERRSRPRPDIVFRMERTAIGSVVKSRKPLVIDDSSVGAADFLDINVLHSAGLRSALVLPLLTRGRAVGTLNVVSRQPAAFDQQHVDVLQPIAEIFAVAHVAQQMQIAMGKYRSMEAMSELTLSIAAEMNSALQTIIGHCDLLERGYPDPDLQRDLSTVVHQAQRISGLLDKMRVASRERMREVAETVNQGGVPSSPEAYGAQELT
jgi:signal transduction protein with GAF and PtsI domain